MSKPSVSKDAVASDLARASAGWERRFVAQGARAEEMIQLYRSLGYDVVADPVTSHQMSAACADCPLPIQLEYRTIYTRRKLAKTDRAPMTETQP